MTGDNLTHFDRFWVKYIRKEIKKIISNKNIHRIQENDSIMCEYRCIGFIEFMLNGKSLLDYTSLFSPKPHKKNDKIILKYF